MKTVFTMLFFCLLISMTALAESSFSENRPNPKHALQGFCWKIRLGLTRAFLGKDCIRIRQREKDGKVYFLHWCGRETQG